jgi:Mrp family chromosome partitioning ATPase
MGKVLDTLRQASQAPPEAPPVREQPEQASFIEVGPHRGMFEASADVLATLPAQPALTAPPGPVVRAPAPQKHPPRLAAELVASHVPGSPAAARYDALLGGLLGALGEQDAGTHPVLLFTSPRQQVGATTVLLNLALSAARQGRRVVAVDANLRRPAVAARLGVAAEPGLTDVLAGDCTLEAALKGTELAGLTALPAGSPTALLACPETLRSLLRQLGEAFDLVLLDGPRWDGRPALSALAAACDAVFLIVPTAAGDPAPPGDLLRLLPQQGIRLAGCILTGP